MKKLLFLIGLTCSVSLHADPELQTQPLLSDAQVFEGFGHAMGVRLQPSALGLSAAERELIIKGFAAALEGKPAQVPEAILRAESQRLLGGRYQEHQQKQAEKSKAAEQAFFEKLRADSNVYFTNSGLGYKFEVPNPKAPVPQVDDVVRLTFKGTLVDGTVFDQALQPVDIVVKDAIQGWIEALTMMPVGTKAMLYIPSKLAYGEGSVGPIPPASALIYELTLHGIRKPQ